MVGPVNIHSVHLLEAAWAMPVLAQWFVAEGAPWYGPDDAGVEARSPLGGKLTAYSPSGIALTIASANSLR